MGTTISCAPKIALTDSIYPTIPHACPTTPSSRVSLIIQGVSTETEITGAHLHRRVKMHLDSTRLSPVRGLALNDNTGRFPSFLLLRYSVEYVIIWLILPKYPSIENHKVCDHRPKRLKSDAALFTGNTLPSILVSWSNGLPELTLPYPQPL